MDGWMDDITFYVYDVSGTFLKYTQNIWLVLKIKIWKVRITPKPIQVLSSEPPTGGSSCR